MEAAPTILTDLEVTETLLEIARERWLRSRAKVERSDGMSADAIRECKDRMYHLDGLLDDYFVLNGGVECAPV